MDIAPKLVRIDPLEARSLEAKVLGLGVDVVVVVVVVGTTHIGVDPFQNCPSHPMTESPTRIRSSEQKNRTRAPLTS